MLFDFAWQVVALTTYLTESLPQTYTTIANGELGATLDEKIDMIPGYLHLTSLDLPNLILLLGPRTSVTFSLHIYDMAYFRTVIQTLNCPMIPATGPGISPPSLNLQEKWDFGNRPRDKDSLTHVTMRQVVVRSVSVQPV